MKGFNKPFSFDMDLLVSCILFWSYVYGGLTIFLEVISLSLYSEILIISTIVLTYVGLWYISVPKPDEALVNEIFGSPNPNLMEFKNDPASNVKDEEELVQDYEDCFTVIGHRGAGLDAPENSLSALKQVGGRLSCAVTYFKKTIKN
jgi:hypothetical protein